ncbi:glutathione-disulfide reductase [Halovulum dunhuangense]|uniref:Glutathione reductase n=1 Tax=Halovulum dunhuangense TaxID=1505036 RepID=A0A849L1Y1_9RHOB|nr:glutathione-disulfide reductase [Halovulum dunhuangense]NNU80254.1 glutathione-disulfide reductase [Halovulum dunhuangense]
MADFDYDLFVIGGGSGGVRASRWAAMTGAKVGLCEEYRYGGTCVIRGCVPKKLMVFAAGFSEAVEDATGFGWKLTGSDFDWPFFIEKKDREIDRLEGVYQANMEKLGVELFRARGVLKDPHTVELSSGQTVTAKHILVATGGAPFMPDVPGAEHAISSNEVFHLERQPKRMLIVGGGYIACEFAGIMNGLGTEVTQFYRGAQILRGFDDEVRGHIAEEMRKKGIALHVGRDLVRIDKTDDGLEVTCTDGSRTTFDCVLYATGRRPATKGLGLEEIGVRLTRNGAIAVDDYSQTSVPSVYAVGDVTDRVNLTPVAIHEGMAFVETVFKANPTPVDHALIPTAVFTQPEIGTIGLTQEAARDRYDIEVYRSTFRPMFHAFAGRDQRMLMKLIVDKASRRVLGVHIVGPAAGEMIQMVGIAVKMGATKEDFDRTMPVHPTAAEELVTMRTAVGGQA